MKKTILATAAAALFLVPQAASAQALPAAVVAVLDIQKATSQCNACKTAFANLESQLNGLKALQTSLDNSLKTEANSIQTAVNALNGKQPDAALTARASAFEKKQQDAQRQLSTRDQTFQRNRAYVFQQISQKLEPAVASVQTRRGATVVLDTSNIVRFSPNLDITNDVIAALNATLTTIGTTAPAQPAATQGR